MPDELVTFFDAYRGSFPAGPASIASFYAEPCVTARAGVVRVNASHADTTALFTEVDKQYRARGFTQADYVILHKHGLGANSILATIRWTYKDATGAAIWETTFSYNLYRRAGSWKILLQTMHDQ